MKVVSLEPLHLGKVDCRKFAIAVENFIPERTFFTPSGEPITLSTYRPFALPHLAGRIEISISGDFTDSMMLDCYSDAEGCITVKPTCEADQQPILEQVLREIRTKYGLPQATSAPISLSTPASERARAQSIITDPQQGGRVTFRERTSESQTGSELAGSHTNPEQVSKQKQKKKSPRSKRLGTAPKVARVRRLVNDRGYSLRGASKIVDIGRGTASQWFNDEEVIALTEKVTDEELDDLLKKAGHLR